MRACRDGGIIKGRQRDTACLSIVTQRWFPFAALEEKRFDPRVYCGVHQLAANKLP
jgi:hypothetical protein